MSNEKQKPTEVSRRQFVGTVATAAGVTIVPRHVLGAGFQAPSDTVNVAVVGYANAGAMGTNNLLNVAKTDNIVALCDCDESAAAKAGRVQRGTTLDKFPKATDYKDFRVMLEKQKDIDAVLVATPDHTHAVIAMAAMQLGKHVYVQKPLTRTVSEARALTEAARKYKVVTQMGNQGHSEEGLRLMQEWLDAGALGQVREVYCWTNRPIWPQGMPRPTDTLAVPDGLDWDLWIGPSPMRPFQKTYHPFGWRAWQDFGAGAMGDMGCHVMDAAIHDPQTGRADERPRNRGLQLSAPGAGRARVRQARRIQRQLSAVLDHPPVFPGARQSGAGEVALVRWGPPPRAARRSRAGSEAAGIGDDLRRRQGQDVVRDLLGEPAPYPGDVHAGLPAPAANAAARAGRTLGAREELVRCDPPEGPGSFDFDYAGPFTESVLLGNVALRYPGVRLMWDAPNMKITNMPDADQFVNHNYRAGWSLST